MKAVAAAGIAAFVSSSLIGVGVVQAQPASAAVAKNSCRSYYLSQGSFGYCVRMAQTLLRGPIARATPSYTYTLATDGDFGPLTKQATIKFQSTSHLAADGVIGPNTWWALCNLYGAEFPRTTMTEQFRQASVETC